jgi:hypothetical protein
MKKTALQWFIEQIENHNGVTRAGFKKCIDEALQMEKEQIGLAHLDGGKNDRTSFQYYNETFKQQEQ